MSNDLIDYNSILTECGVGSSPSSLVIKNIQDLSEHYNSLALIGIYNHILLNVNDAEILLHVIKLTDLNRNLSTLQILLDMLKNNIKVSEEDYDNFINVKALCAKAISNYKDNSTVMTLLDCMNNKNEHYKVRLACADALGRIGDKYAVTSLIDVVEDDEEKSVYLKESATFALGLLGDIRAIDPLVSILESKQGLLDKFSFLKERIVEALGKLNLNNKKVLKALSNSLMDSSPLVRINAIEAIMNSEDDNAISLIRPSLKDEDDEVKRNALIALYNLSGRDILDEIIELPTYSEFLRNEAKSLLEEYEGNDE
ncbi:MAG: HEAT repeat domain-containing protein [Cyanobacteria bacterium SIG31]|nr:HEAT repeat domain-containing protein [Cyanobacteria bacterium SIG31]